MSSAVKIIFKRSSLLGKRPTNQNLEPGEIGLNTNSTDPGLFFEVNSGSVVKAGPTAYLPDAPTTTPARGELWVDSDTKAMSIGTADKTWQEVAAPFLGGTGGFTVFVGPEYPNATDSLANDGQTVPFVTINRAILEVTKQIIRDTLSGVSLGNNRYLIFLAPGQHCVVNSPGASVTNFTVDFSDPYTEVTQELLAQFNSEEPGGLIIPRGVSIIGLDLKKVELHPTYVPFYTHPAFPANYRLQGDGPIYQNQPVSSLFRWSGNTYISNFTALDKIEYRLVTGIEKAAESNVAIFKTSRPHGLGYNDFVKITYSDTADQIGATFADGAYYARPVTAFTFSVSRSSWDSASAAGVEVSEFNQDFFATDAPADPKFNVSNIFPYYTPLDGESYELHGYSHHRLSVLKNASLQELNNFYVKVQRAFPTFFGGQVNSTLVSPPEYDIVASTVGNYPDNLSSNSTDNSSPYQNMVNHRSDYGMANGDYNGDLVSGFKSVIINSSTAVILQKDPCAYEIYSSSAQDWLPLARQTQDNLGNTLPIYSIPTSNQLSLLNDTAIPDIRYYYETLKVTDPQDGLPKSIGLPDPDKDFRHFGFRMSGSNSYMQAQSTYTIGAAIAAWAKNGGLISLTNATTNFGSVAFQAEGFAGIGTLGGANPINRNFLQEGIVRPLALDNASVASDSQKRILSLGSSIQYVGIDPADPAVQLIYLQTEFDPATILPFSLKPGTAVFTSDGTCGYRAFFVTDGTPTCILSGSSAQNPYSPGGAVLRVRLSDSTIPLTQGTPDPVNGAYLDVPFIRRFIDPRTQTQKSYGFRVTNSDTNAQAPQLGSVLRLNQTGQNLSTTLKRNYQLDPGQYGGFAQIFTVDAVETSDYSTSINFNNKISDASQSTSYTAYMSVTDGGGGWLQSVYVAPQGLIPYNVPSGFYQTYQNRNYYLAENNLWSSLYYTTTFSANNGPTKVAPLAPDSSYVTSSVLERSELITETWQGRSDLIPEVLDPVYRYYVLGEDLLGNPVPAAYVVPDSYKLDNPVSYFRGATVPFEEYSGEFVVDDDDGSETLGIVYHRFPVSALKTAMVSASVAVQTYAPMSPPWSTTPTFGRPATMEIDLLSMKNVINPKQGLSVLLLSNPSIPAIEYVRVIRITGNKALVLRNYYNTYYNPPELAVTPSGWVFIGEPGGTYPTGIPVPPTVWPAGTEVTPCVSTEYPEPEVYDPFWGVTKSTVYRYYQLLGFNFNVMRNYLIPQRPGKRTFLNTEIQTTPVGGYANLTQSYPVEFNNPSTVIANTHTWQYCGYFDYSRGLPKYQVNQITRKLSYDYLCTTVFGGRLTVVGAVDNGNIVFLGPVREALTGNFFLNDTPILNFSNRLQYQAPAPVEQPAPILVYSVDDISSEFDGLKTTFELKRGGYPVPSGQLSTYGVFVFLGGVVQKPNEAYQIATTSGLPIPQIVFSEAPPAGASCDIRVVSSEDDSKTLEVIPFTHSPTFDGIQSSFTLSPDEPTLTNLNSFIFLGGVEQNPAGLAQVSAAYSVSNNTLTFIGGAPLAGTTFDGRGILSGSTYRNSGVSSVFVSSVDDISPLFDNTTTTFALQINGVAVDATKVNAENMFVSLGGVMQIPIAQSANPLAGLAYTVGINPVTAQLEITFASAPLTGTTCNIRVITADNFLTCPLPPNFGDDNVRLGPGITVNDENEIIGIDPGIIGT